MVPFNLNAVQSVINGKGNSIADEEKEDDAKERTEQNDGKTDGLNDGSVGMALLKRKGRDDGSTQTLWDHGSHDGAIEYGDPG